MLGSPSPIKTLLIFLGALDGNTPAPCCIALSFTLGSSLGPDALPVDIARGALLLAQDLQKSTGKPFTVIVDTAGRQVIDGPLMAELFAIKAAVKPDEVLLVVDAMTGQEAATLTERFNRWQGKNPFERLIYFSKKCIFHAYGL